jgi:hypothetical protein
MSSGAPISRKGLSELLHVGLLGSFAMFSLRVTSLLIGKDLNDVIATIPVNPIHQFWYMPVSPGIKRLSEICDKRPLIFGESLYDCWRGHQIENRLSNTTDIWFVGTHMLADTFFLLRKIHKDSLVGVRYEILGRGFARIR